MNDDILISEQKICKYNIPDIKKQRIKNVNYINVCILLIFILFIYFQGYYYSLNILIDKQNYKSLI